MKNAPRGPGPRRTRYVGPGPAPLRTGYVETFFFKKFIFDKIEGIRRFHRSDEIRREKLHLLVYITPPETSFESSYDPNTMLMDDDG